MKYKKFKDEVNLSRLGMGIMRLPVTGAEEDGPIDYEKAQTIVDYAMAQGVNYYDTAYNYHGGDSERFVGAALKKYPRDSYYLADKFNKIANPDYRAQFREQLERLGMDRIDFYLLHSIQDSFIDEIEQNGCIPYFDEKKKQGIIRYFGFSFHGTPDGLRRMLTLYKWDFVQIQLNYYDWNYGDAKELYEILAKAEIPVMVMEPVHGGALASLPEEAEKLLKAARPEKSIASWAMRWVLSLPGVQTVLSGMSNTEQMADNARTFSEGEPLSGKEQALVKEACELYRPTVAVACTGCRYCCADCPQELDIPRLLTIYNDMKLGGDWRSVSIRDLPQEKWPTNCIDCGNCVERCPQNFRIPEYMREMSGAIETKN